MKWIRSFFSEPQTIEDVVATLLMLLYFAIGGVVWISEDGWSAGQIVYYAIGGAFIIFILRLLDDSKSRRLAKANEPEN